MLSIHNIVTTNTSSIFGCAADSCGWNRSYPQLSTAIPSSAALSAAQPQHIRSTSAAHLYSLLLPSLSTDATLSIDGAPSHRRHHGAAISLTRPPAPSPSVIVDRRYWYKKNNDLREILDVLTPERTGFTYDRVLIFLVWLFHTNPVDDSSSESLK